MSDMRTRRISRELFAAAAGATLAVEPWVTDRLAAILEEEEFGEDEPVYRAGDAPDHFFFMQKGEALLVGERGRREIVRGPRAFGMVDALIERPRESSAYARTPLQLLRVPFDAWLELIEDSFDLARASLGRLAYNVARLEERLWSAGRELPPPARLGLETTAARLDVVERLAVLMQAAPMRGAGAQPVSDLAMLCEEIALRPGDRLVDHGAEANRAFVIVGGRVEATRQAPSAVWRGGPGEMVCGAAALGGRLSDWEAHAVPGTRVLAFRLDDWLDVMEENFEMVRATLACLAVEHDRLGGEL